MATRTIGNNLRRLRGALSQSELARRAGLHRNHIAKIEAGQRRNLHFETVRRLSAALACEPEDILGPPRKLKRTG